MQIFEFCEHLCVSAAENEIHTFLLTFIGIMPVSDEGEGDDRVCGARWKLTILCMCNIF